MDPLKLLQEFVSLPGPPGQEELVREAFAAHVRALGYKPVTDAKGNLVVSLGGTAKTVVTAHLDEIAMIVRSIDADGKLCVGPLGGLFPWKLGEGPVDVLADEPIEGILSFGSIHTEAPSPARDGKSTLTWDASRVITGRGRQELLAMGVRPGCRVVVAPAARGLIHLNGLVAGRFLDDRADLVAMLLALDMLKGESMDVDFVASASEETGGEGALYYLQAHRPQVCVALELGPNVSDARVEINDQPTVWANDSYAAMSAKDGALLARIGQRLGMALQYQALSRGGSDASCAASKGLCARPITLGLPMDNSHGFEIMHPGSMLQLATLTVELLRHLATE